MDKVRQFLLRSIELANQTIEYADECRFGGHLSNLDINMLAAFTDRLLAKTRSMPCYDSHVRVMASDTEFDLDPEMIALLLTRPRGEDCQNGLENIMGDVSRLLGLMNLLFPTASDRDLLFHPPEETRDLVVQPLDLEAEICYCIEEWINNCDRGSPSNWKSEVGLLRSCSIKDREDRMITKGVRVMKLFNLLKASWKNDPTTAIIALRMMAKDPETVGGLVNAALFQVFVKILREGHMVVQAEVAAKIGELVAVDPKWQGIFCQHQLIRLLVKHLKFNMDGGNLEDAIYINKASSVLATVMATYHLNRRKTADEEDKDQDKTLLHQAEDFPSYPCLEARMKEMAAKALGGLAKGNSSVCRALAELGAPVCFSIMLEEGTENVKYNSAVALMEITAVAEQDSDFRRSFFKPSSHAFKAIVGQLLKTIESYNTSPGIFLPPCIKAVGNLARTFRDTRAITPLVRLLQLRKSEACEEALIALIKFTSREYFLHGDNSKAITTAKGMEYLVPIASDEEIDLAKSALVLLCHIVLDVPDNKDSDFGDALTAIRVASRKSHISKDEAVQALVQEVNRHFRQ